MKKRCTAGTCLYRRVFTSSIKFKPGIKYQPQGSTFASVKDADDACKALAKTANLGGNWMAWIGDSADACKRYLSDLIDKNIDTQYDATVPVYLVNGVTSVANSGFSATPNYCDTNPASGNYFVSKAGHSAALNMNEKQETISATPNAWTGTTAAASQALFGTAKNCNNWNSSATTEQGQVGQISATTADWISTSTTLSCDQEAHLYCVEYYTKQP